MQGQQLFPQWFPWKVPLVPTPPPRVLETSVLETSCKIQEKTQIRHEVALRKLLRVLETF